MNYIKNTGGWFLKIASRSHLEKIPYLLKEVLEDHLKNIKPDYIAVTVRPGLLGSLLIGYNTALALSIYYKKPLIPIHHLEAHFYAVLLSGYMIHYPFLGLLVSGGNSTLYIVKGLGEIEMIGDTHDDACGEALDKAAQLLGLPYPGGPHIEQMSNSFLKAKLAEGHSEKNIHSRNPLPQILKEQRKDEFHFSFSGIKTALLYMIKKNKDQYSKAEMAYYFQQRLIQIILRNVQKALDKYDLNMVVAAGGVMANKTLREALSKMLQERQRNVVLQIPPIKFCTDNGAMIASTGYLYYQKAAWPIENGISSNPSFF